jgi:serine-type D-Ala-D-Ala carboxypeptidase/endopeptidase
MLLNYGTTAKDGGQPMTSNTVYEIGSITKVFTGILLAEAVNAGKAQFDDPIQNYLPAGIQSPTYNGIPITLVNLATHHAALPRDLDSDNIPDMYAWLNTYQLASAPGSKYSYSNLGYSLLGDILARLYGNDFGTLEYEAISQPLGLMDTRETLTSDQQNRLAQGYTADGALAAYFPDSGAMSSAGYLHSTLNDMTRFLIENMQPNSTPLASSINLTQLNITDGQEPGSGTGLGWEIERPNTPTERIYKGGGTSGFTTYISFAKDGSSGFVLLTNGQYVNYLVPTMLQLLGENGN